LRYIGDRGIRDAEGAKRYIDKIVNNYHVLGFGLYAMELKDTGEVVGLCGLLKREYLPAVDIGYALLPQFEGRGLALEACRSVMEIAVKELEMDTVFAIVTPANARSIHLLEKLGFNLEKEIEEGGEPLLVYKWIV
ncbi:MAG: GNAT family N-acetyltransferase, partial [Chitinophagaceae bacterium]|nr:GNAT family N-acetyltransferase [Chitinophagaceae bacterium]